MFRRGGTALVFMIIIMTGNSVSAWEVFFGLCKFSDDSGLGTVAREGSCPTTSGSLHLRSRGVKVLPADVFANMPAMTYVFVS